MIARTHVTLEDVARLANVSLATASRVLNGTATVRDDLRDRVRTAATDLGYSPNVHAQALAGAAHQPIGVVCDDAGDPYFASIIRGVLRAADHNGLLVMLMNTFRDPEKEVAAVSVLRGQRASAILLAGSAFEDRAWERALAAELEPYRRGGGRVGVLTRHRSLKADSVQPENKAGAKALAEALVRLGHRRFAVLTGPRTMTTVLDRFAGFREGLAESGIELAARDVFEGGFDRDGGHAAASALVAARHRASCVFALNDQMALGAMSALREAGRSIPDDVSVAGFDDIPVARDLNPSLTTVALPLERLGEQVLDLALSGARAGRARVRRVAGEVVLRDSTVRVRRRRR